ncbi:toll/interleukin-1 receptor domain-containing protein [Paenibacillus silvae]|uniref:toll/interleukin-1 receptor domain-containing protein n=1 Tax=Paenibacillus silvae TaxID=1325358 RepID=UPI00200585F5|nr:toll/interleukin-1 receptor domain-containing protein [Paenibacillus silvae]MCK6075357.1 TIR domain-containing protein [Paenibacillus silvae]MCK6149744.1 TIR domain-containing protein [Paenibacillus silvae]MCK6268042.1 TIR domain-containing protein [Paenibacillus silvae]
MSIKLFISHATKDKALVEHFVNFLESAIRVNPEEIYCTSINGTIPTGVGFVDHMRGHITSAELVIFLITENYFKSPFCLAEMGAAWGLNQNIYPIIVEPLKFDVLNATPLAGVQAIKLNSEGDVTKMYEEFKQKGIIENLQVLRFNNKLPEFIKGLDNVIIKPVDDSVTIEEYQQVRNELDQTFDELNEKDSEIKRLKNLVAELEEAKDPQDVLAIKMKNTGAWDNFTQLVERVRNRLKPLPNFVISAIYNERYSQYDFYPTDADWNAIKTHEADGLLIVDIDRGRIIPDSDDPQVYNAIKSIDELEYYLQNSAPEELYNQFVEKYETRLDISKKKFWESVFYTNITVA